MGGLSQEKASVLLARAVTGTEVEEVLHAYVLSKYIRGATASQVLRKLHLCTMYLRAIDLGYILQQHYEAFAVAAYLAKSLDSDDAHGRALLERLPTTSLGAEAVNAARRHAPTSLENRSSNTSVQFFRRIGLGKRGRAASQSSITTYGSVGSGSDAGWSRRTTPAASDDEVEVDEADENATIGPGRPALGSRTTSSTALGRPTGPTRQETQELARRAAGAGTVEGGLGRGLLSAPPRYDGGVAAYVAQFETAPQAGRLSFEELPDYIPT